MLTDKMLTWADVKEFALDSFPTAEAIILNERLDANEELWFREIWNVTVYMTVGSSFKANGYYVHVDSISVNGSVAGGVRLGGVKLRFLYIEDAFGAVNLLTRFIYGMPIEPTHRPVWDAQEVSEWIEQHVSYPYNLGFAAVNLHRLADAMRLGSFQPKPVKPAWETEWKGG